MHFLKRAESKASYAILANFWICVKCFYGVVALIFLTACGRKEDPKTFSPNVYPAQMDQTCCDQTCYSKESSMETKAPATAPV